MRFFIILGILFLAEAYAFMAVRSAVSGMSNVWRITLLVSYLFFTALTWTGFLLFRQINWAAMPHLLRNVYIAFVLGFTVGKILVLLIMLVDDLRRLLTWLISSMVYGNTATADGQGNGIKRSEFLRNTALVLGGFSILGFTWGITNRYRYRVRKLKFAHRAVPHAFKGLRIVQISDIHTGSFDNHAAVAHGIERVMDQKPDLILFTGDLVNNHAEEVDSRYVEIFSKLSAPLGVYSTLGNHDYGDYVHWPSAEAKKENLERLKRTHANMGWRLLMNEHVELERAGEKIALIGIENWSAKANFTRYGDLGRAYAGLSEKAIPFKILMSHDPSHWHAQVVPEYKDVHLTLSGHTHGMQFGVESKWLKWSPVQYMYNEWAGLYSDGEQHLYVNRGFGFLGYPGRLGVMPEITVIELA